MPWPRSVKSDKLGYFVRPHPDKPAKQIAANKNQTVAFMNPLKKRARNSGLLFPIEQDESFEV